MNLPAMQETWVWFLSLEDPRRREWWPTPVWTEEPDRLQSMGLQRAGHNWATNTVQVPLGAVKALSTILTFSRYQARWNPKWVGGRAKTINKPKARATAATCFHIIKTSIFLKNHLTYCSEYQDTGSFCKLLGKFWGQTREACEISWYHFWRSQNPR